MGYREATPEEMDAIFHPKESPAQVIGQDLPKIEKAPIVPGAVQRQPKPKQAQATVPNVEDLTSSVINANKQIQENIPKPQPASAVDELVRQATSSWTTLLPLAIPALGYGIYKAMGGGDDGGPPPPPGGTPKSPSDRSMSKNLQIDRTVDIPMDSAVQPTEKPNPIAQAQQKLADVQKAMELKGPAPAPITPATPVLTAPPTVPTVTQAVETGQSPTKSIQADIAPMVDQAVPVEKSAPPPADKSVQGRTRRTAEQIAAELESAIANAPEGRLPSAPNPKKSNKLLPSDVIGQGGWHWYQGQLGPEAETEWLRQFGRTNQSYADVKQAVREGRLKGPIVPEGKKGGAFTREPTVPNYIKGGIRPEMALNLAGNAIGAVGLGQAFKHAQKTGDWSDFGLGLAGQILGNVAPRAGMAFGLMAPGQLASGTLDSPEARALGIAPPR